MQSQELDQIRQQMRENTHVDEGAELTQLAKSVNFSDWEREDIVAHAAKLIREIRTSGSPGIMEVFLGEYGLSTDEGIALMCMAEALLRVPDAETIDALIEDKIAPSEWGKHLGKSSSSLVNASTWGLLLTGKVLDSEQPGISGMLRNMVKRLGEPLIRTAVSHAMREMGKQFVLGCDIDEAIKRGQANEEKGYTFSYDMLGEAAMTETDARGYHLAYSKAITAIARNCTSQHIHNNPGISVKLSALHARYEFAKSERVARELVQRTLSLAQLARSAGMGFNIDAEEADRLDLSLDVIEAVLSDPVLAGWDGFGVVVQAYGPRASFMIDWLYALVQKLDRRIMVRLVKGAYWDMEIKQAQVNGLDGFPVFTCKASTDVAYIASAHKLLGMTDRIYPQFATHNAHTVAAILEIATDKDAFEFQRLHGMGKSLHDIVLKQENTHCRIYAPVGAHRDLLAYLVRRLLENGANSSFVNQIVDEDVPAEVVANDPFAIVDAFDGTYHNPAIKLPCNLYGEGRINSKGYDLSNPIVLTMVEKGCGEFRKTRWQASPLTVNEVSGGKTIPVENPFDTKDNPGSVLEASAQSVEAAISAATVWQAAPETRVEVLRRASDLYEEHAFELYALATREAGKTLLDGIGEVREAVDFLRYYAAEIIRLENAQCGLFACISPWNFPLAIFTGQIAAALAAGNGVLAKPAEATPLIAWRAVQLMHEAGVPPAVLQLLPGQGDVVGSALTQDDRINGVCFTGSTRTAQLIHRSMSQNLSPHAPLIAETGGLNAMIVDSSALPEQAIRDIVTSAFQSAGQRCSALRLLYVQEDISDTIESMLLGAMDELQLGNPWDIATDVGPVIDEVARTKIQAYIANAHDKGTLLRQLDVPEYGNFVGPSVIRVDGIVDLHEEIFGPVLHITTFKAKDINKVVQDINASGYGLTFGLHTRIDDRVQKIVEQLKAGNIYVNRNQIGAVVGSQPFGGEGLSGTGPKAGGPGYLQRFTCGELHQASVSDAKVITLNEAQVVINSAKPTNDIVEIETIDLPGPTGESNRLSIYPRGTVLCLGPDAKTLKEQVRTAQGAGCLTVVFGSMFNEPGGDIESTIQPEYLTTLSGFHAVAFQGDAKTARLIRKALSERDGPMIARIGFVSSRRPCRIGIQVCMVAAASGGNTSLLVAAGDVG